MVFVEAHAVREIGWPTNKRGVDGFASLVAAAVASGVDAADSVHAAIMILIILHLHGDN